MKEPAGDWGTRAGSSPGALEYPDRREEGEFARRASKLRQMRGVPRCRKFFRPWRDDAISRGFTSDAFRSRILGMEHAFDDIAAALRASPARLRDRYGAIVLRLAEGLATGLAIGVGFAIVHAVAG